MNFLSEEILDYCQNNSTPEIEALRKLNRETHAKVLKARMLSGHLQGNVLATFSHMIRPKRVLEIGTFTGYSAICLAQGLTENGILHSIEINEELESMIKNYISEANLTEKIQLHIGNALEIIPNLPEMFDLVFIDADKLNYSAYYDLVLPKVKIGGFIIADNVLWSGKVVDPKAKDKDTLSMLAFNKKIQEDERVFNTLFPIRDGLMVAIRQK